MLNNLRYKLTFICALITATVLSITVISTFIVNCNQLNLRSHQELNSELNNLIYYIQNSFSNARQVYTISDHWLSQLEATSNLIIYTEDNHQPMLFKGGYTLSIDRNELIEVAKETATDEYDFDFYTYTSSDGLPNTLFFDLKLPSKKHYLVGMASMYMQNNTFQMIILKDMQENDHQIHGQLMLYTLFFIIGTFILTLFSFWFSGKAIAPIMENDKKQKDFIAAASHELRSPLAVLQTNTSALASEYPNIVPSPFFHSIETECKRMTRLINDLLLLSHADTKVHWSLELQPVAIDTLLIETYDSFYLEAKRCDHHLTLDLPDKLTASYSLDAQRISQVLAILLHNALSYTPEGTLITLSLSCLGNELSISVIDNGPGIPDEYKAHVFERFYRIDPARHKKEHSGLGLCIAKEIVQLHHGQLLLKDTSPHGCTFEMILPIK